MESAWCLALVVKSVVISAGDGDAECSSSSSIAMLLQHPQFVDAVHYLAHLATRLSRKWNVEDLEVMDCGFLAKNTTQFHCLHEKVQ